MTYKPFTKEEEEQVVDLYKKGFSYGEIGKKLKRPSNTIYLKIRLYKRSIAKPLVQEPKKRIVKTPAHTVEKKPCIVHLGLISDLFEFADSPHTPAELKAQADSLGRAIFLLGNRAC